MLPFLKPKTVAGLIVSTRKKDGSGIEEQHSEGDEGAPIEACAEDLIRAVHAKDAKGVAAAFRAAFEILEMEPHEEADHDYDSQNEKAAAEE